MKTLFLMLLLACPLAAQAYTVSAGAQTYSDLTGGTSLTLGDEDITAEINPAGFAFTYFGQTYTGFKVCDNGFLILGGAGTTTSNIPDHGTSWPGPTIAPFWTNAKTGTGLAVPAADRIGWDFTGGVLTVEWRWLETDPNPSATQWDPSAMRCKAALDQNTGVIEFSYGDPRNPPGQIILICTCVQPRDHTCSICDDTGTIIDGVDAPYFVDATGQIDVYPQNRFIRFTPTTPPLAISTTSPLAPGTEGDAYSQQFAAANGSGAETWSATGLPTGFAMSSSGLLTCAAPTIGTYSFSVQVQDAATMAIKPFDLTVNPAALAIASPAAGPLAAGTEGQPYFAAFTATGGTQPYTWTVALGALPAGLTLQSTGTLDGTPTLAGDYAFTVMVADAAFGTDTRAYTIHINAPATVGGVSGSGGGGGGCAAGGAGAPVMLLGLLLWRRRRNA